jgi:hypothetical protein
MTMREVLGTRPASSIFVGLLVLGAVAVRAHAADLGCDCRPTRRADVHPHVRAGCPQSIAWWAQPSNSAHYGGYYVGGGALCHGDGRCADEGTWGWDYLGALFTKHVRLGWSHGRLYQGGAGAYETDGPKVLHHE